MSIKNELKLCILWTASRVRRHPALLNLTLRSLAYTPRLKTRLRALVESNCYSTSPLEQPEHSALSPNLNTPKMKDFSLNSGERQVATELSQIRFDHRVRYQLVLDVMQQNETLSEMNCLDIFCGNGYGAYMLASSRPLLTVLALDGSDQAIELANNNYALPNIIFSVKRFPFTLPSHAFDYITCFESLEHVENDTALLNKIEHSLRKGGFVMVSVPNEECHSLSKNPHPFHFRHYLHAAFLNQLPQNFTVKKWWGQNVYEFDDNGVNTNTLLDEDLMRPIENKPGQVNIYLLQKT
jgi:2-polyprenyl-3-methyl-5-hydroxy-6-metoxy-1,4-benzoquinol methylase